MYWQPVAYMELLRRAATSRTGQVKSRAVVMWDPDPGRGFGGGFWEKRTNQTPVSHVRE